MKHLSGSFSRFPVIPDPSLSTPAVSQPGSGPKRNWSAHITPTLGGGVPNSIYLVPIKGKMEPQMEICRGQPPPPIQFLRGWRCAHTETYKKSALAERASAWPSSASDRCHPLSGKSPRKNARSARRDCHLRCGKWAALRSHAKSLTFSGLHGAEKLRGWLGATKESASFQFCLTVIRGPSEKKTRRRVWGSSLKC